MIGQENGDVRLSSGREPRLNYRLQTEAKREAAKTKNKRNNKDGAVTGTFDVLDEFKDWAEYVGEYNQC